jgi:hypothetical protein
MVHDIYLEIGKKQVIASVVDWPGWCRGAKDEAEAIQALYDLAPRYAAVMEGTNLGLQPPESIEGFEVVERVQGNATTDYGVPAMEISSDQEALDDDTVERYRTVLDACWRYFDDAVARAEGRELRKGPRGGGRELDGILEHVMGADLGYLSTVGHKVQDIDGTLPERLAHIREGIFDALEAGARGELPAKGPRGGKRWKPRYFVRRVAYHVLDHAWEIEDRVL